VYQKISVFPQKAEDGTMSFIIHVVSNMGGSRAFTRHVLAGDTSREQRRAVLDQALEVGRNRAIEAFNARQARGQDDPPAPDDQI